MIRRADVTETSPHRFVTEASTIRIAPGQRPTILRTELGNQQPFVLGQIDQDGTLHYAQNLGCIYLIVLND